MALKTLISFLYLSYCETYVVLQFVILNLHIYFGFDLFIKN